MPRALLLTVRFHDGRYYGAGSWPPAPARLFQALVAGAAEGGMIPPVALEALAWLETLEPPILAAPSARAGQPYKNYVPNNDLDAKGGDFGRLPEIRVPKQIRPRLFDAGAPLLYVWRFDRSDEMLAKRICAIAERLYQLGRGVDMAWATGEIVGDDKAVDDRFAVYNGVVCRPSGGGEGRTFAVPLNGSLQSLKARFEGGRARFERTRSNRTEQTLFKQPPKPRFRQVAYNSPPRRLLFESHETAPEGGFRAWPFTDVVRLVETVRDGAAKALGGAMPDRAACIDRVFIGRNATEADKASRIRILPLPSIGHAHADRAIRRLVVEVPPDCPLEARDIAWAFMASPPHDPVTGELAGWQLVEIGEEDAGDRFTAMPAHYGIGRSEVFRVWRTVTPAALPEHAARRRIDPGRIPEDAKGARERVAEETRAAASVHHALRHAGITTPVDHIRVQREPFQAKGARAEAFASDTRFSKHRLWHVEIAFTTPRSGPLVIGDGRYLGLGIMAPVKHASRDVLVLPLPPETVVPIGDAGLLVNAVRRALMALSRDDRGDVSPLFSGHETDGGPARSGRHQHVFLAADDADEDGRIDRLIVAAPWACDRSSKPRSSRRGEFERIVCSLRTLRAGRPGILDFDLARALEEHDALVGPACTWLSRTDYHPTGHAGRRKDLAAAVEQDLINECLRRGFPRPVVEVNSLTAGPRGGGIAVRARLHFRVAISGPILLGRDAHRGGGLFAAAPAPPADL